MVRRTAIKINFKPDPGTNIKIILFIFINLILDYM